MSRRARTRRNRRDPWPDHDDTNTTTANQGGFFMPEEAMTTTKKYPEGALLRVSDICRDTKRGNFGILPITRSTWHRWVESGKAPAGLRLAGTPVWPIEQVRALAVAADAAA